MSCDVNIEIARLRAVVSRLSKLVYVPGLLRCAKCGFQLVTNSLNVRDGTITAIDKTDNCPNGCGPLWRVTERDAGNDMVDRCEEQVKRAVEAEKRAEQAEAQLAKVVRESEGAKG